WSFPGGRPTYDRSLEESLKDEVKKKTGLDVEVKKLIFVRTLPEKKEFMCLYYYCEPIGGIEKAGEKFKEIKWIKPTDILKYSKISTSIDPFIFNFLKKIRGR
ncbi:MAG: NUDIX hydrolase, partial [Methanosarcinales archaeon]